MASPGGLTLHLTDASAVLLRNCRSAGRCRPTRGRSGVCDTQRHGRRDSGGRRDRHPHRPRPVRGHRQHRPPPGDRAVRDHSRGLQRLLGWLRSHGEVLAVGIEGTGAYGAATDGPVRPGRRNAQGPQRDRGGDPVCAGGPQARGQGTHPEHQPDPHPDCHRALQAAHGVNDWLLAQERTGRVAIPQVSASTLTKARKADSTGRRNTSIVEVLMGRPAGWMKELTGRSPMKSPGKPSLRPPARRRALLPARGRRRPRSSTESGFPGLGGRAG